MLTTNKKYSRKPTIFEKAARPVWFFKISTLPSNCKEQLKEKKSYLYQLAFYSEAVPNAACVQLIILRRNGPRRFDGGPISSYFVLT